jgi:hypothetical protein
MLVCSLLAYQLANNLYSLPRSQQLAMRETENKQKQLA